MHELGIERDPSFFRLIHKLLQCSNNESAKQTCTLEATFLNKEERLYYALMLMENTSQHYCEVSMIIAHQSLLWQILLTYD